MEYKYQIGQDCWLVTETWPHLHRVHIKRRGTFDDEKGSNIFYEAENDKGQYYSWLAEDCIFDVATRCHDALCYAQKVIEKK